MKNLEADSVTLIVKDTYKPLLSISTWRKLGILTLFR